MRLPTKTIERALFRAGYRQVIGVDEVGMGCLAGPVVVCAVAFTPGFYARVHRKLFNLRDSKLLSSRQREVFVQELLKIKNLKLEIAYCRPETIDRMNIYQAARHAMRRAVRGLVISDKFQVVGKELNQNPKTYNLEPKTIVLVDGPNKIAALNLEQMPIVQGDRNVFAIACASVIAKVHRDRMMARYARKFPGYAFEIHKGYGTKLHCARLADLGPSPIHRRSFARLSFWAKDNPKPWASPKT